MTAISIPSVDQLGDGFVEPSLRTAESADALITVLHVGGDREDTIRALSKQNPAQ